MPRLRSYRTSRKLNTKFPFSTVYFLGVWGLSASSYIVYTFYRVYIHFYTIYLFISNAIEM